MPLVFINKQNNSSQFSNTRGDSSVLKHFYYIYKFHMIKLLLQNVFNLWSMEVVDQSTLLMSYSSVLLVMEWSSFLHLSRNARLRPA